MQPRIQVNNNSCKSCTLDTCSDYHCCHMFISLKLFTLIVHICGKKEPDQIERNYSCGQATELPVHSSAASIRT